MIICLDIQSLMFQRSPTFRPCCVIPNILWSRPVCTWPALWIGSWVRGGDTKGPLWMIECTKNPPKISVWVELDFQLGWITFPNTKIMYGIGEYTALDRSIFIWPGDSVLTCATHSMIPSEWPYLPAQNKNPVSKSNNSVPTAQACSVYPQNISIPILQVIWLHRCWWGVYEQESDNYR